MAKLVTLNSFNGMNFYTIDSTTNKEGARMTVYKILKTFLPQQHIQYYKKMHELDQMKQSQTDS